MSKRNWALAVSISDFPCCRHPLKAALDPAKGTLLLVGTETGCVYAYDLQRGIAQSLGGDGVVPPSHVLRHSAVLSQSVRGSGLLQHHAEAEAKGAAESKPIYCVAWNPRLQMIAVAGRFPGAKTSLLCHAPASAVAGSQGRCDVAPLTTKGFDQKQATVGA